MISLCLTGEMNECYGISVLRPKSAHAHNPADFKCSRLLRPVNPLIP